MSIGTNEASHVGELTKGLSHFAACRGEKIPKVSRRRLIVVAKVVNVIM